MNQRQFSRVIFRATATLLHPDGAVLRQGEIHNISMRGMLMDIGEPTLVPGTDVIARITLCDKPCDLSFSLGATVVRASTHQCALRFLLEDVPVDTLAHLRRIISCNMGNDDAVMDEWIDATFPRQDKTTS